MRTTRSTPAPTVPANVPPTDAPKPSRWTFLSNHGHVLLCIRRDPTARIRDIAERVGITERAAQGILSDLVEAGYVERHRVGRRNNYLIAAERELRHPMESDHRVGELLDLLVD